MPNKSYDLVERDEQGCSRCRFGIAPSRLNEIPINPFRINCWFEYEHRRHDSTTPLEQEFKCASLILLSQVRMVQDVKINFSRPVFKGRRRVINEQPEHDHGRSSVRVKNSPTTKTKQCTLLLFWCTDFYFRSRFREEGSCPYNNQQTQFRTTALQCVE